MPLPKIKITRKKDGREVAWFRDTQGRVRTGDVNGMYGVYGINWTRAEQIRELADYGIAMQLDQARAGLGSDGAPMPPLKQPKRAKRWSTSQKKVVEYGTTDRGYPAFKRKLGLKPIRDLTGPGGLVVSIDSGGNKRYRRSARHMQGRGHMLDDIRVNYLDDKRATIAITNSASRVKARANEQRAPWWGWSPASYRKMIDRAASIFQTGAAEALFTMGLIGAQALSEAKRMWRKVA